MVIFLEPYGFPLPQAAFACFILLIRVSQRCQQLSVSFGKISRAAGLLVLPVRALCEGVDWVGSRMSLGLHITSARWTCGHMILDHISQ